MNNDRTLRIMYVEDDPDSFEMLKMMLSIHRIEVAQATSVRDALTLAGEERFDLYLLDSGLPDGDGYGLCRTLRAVDPDRPVLFYSGNARPEEIQMGMAAGADGYITKPHSDKLAETIIQLVANRGLRSYPSSLSVLQSGA